MKVSKRQLQTIIKEEKRKLLIERQLGPMISAQPINKVKTRRPSIAEQPESLIGDMTSQLEENLAMYLRDFFEEAVAAEDYQGTGPTWEKEIGEAAYRFEQALVDSGALKMVMEMFNAIEEELHDGQYAQ